MCDPDGSPDAPPTEDTAHELDAARLRAQALAAGWLLPELDALDLEGLPTLDQIERYRARFPITPDEQEWAYLIHRDEVDAFLRRQAEFDAGPLTPDETAAYFDRLLDWYHRHSIRAHSEVIARRGHRHHVPPQ